MRRAIFHIGAHKTGTTTIQSTLASNRDVLLGEGILYPSSGTIAAGGHLNLAYETLGTWKYNEQSGSWGDAVDEVHDAGSECVIISAETFSGYRGRPEILEAIQDFCHRIDAKPEIIGYARAQYSYLDSIYAQNASTGYETRKFDAFLVDALAGKDYELEAVFGRWFDRFEDVRVIPFEPPYDVPITEKFLMDLQLEGPRLRDDNREKMNERTTVRAVEYARKATQVLASHGILSKPMRHRVAGQIAQRCNSEFQNDRRFSGLTHALANQAEERFAESNGDFARTRMGVSSFFSRSVGEQEFQRAMLDLDSTGASERDRFLAVVAAVLAELNTS